MKDVETLGSYRRGAIITAILLCICLITCLFWSPQAEADTVATSPELDTVCVSGKAEVKVAPDKCSVDVGVDLKKPTAQEANAAMGVKSDAIIKALKGAGIKEEDIQTTYYSVDVEYRWDDDERKVTGYRGSCSITVNGIDIDNIEKVIDASMNAGADEIGRIRYYCSDFSARYNEALTEAIKAARAKADKMGEAGNFRVIRVHNMQEGYQNDSAKYVTNSVAVMEDVAMGETSSSVSAGELTIEARVSVEYVIG